MSRKPNAVRPAAAAGEPTMKLATILLTVLLVGVLLYLARTLRLDGTIRNSNSFGNNYRGAYSHNQLCWNTILHFCWNSPICHFKRYGSLHGGNL